MSGKRKALECFDRPNDAHRQLLRSVEKAAGIQTVADPRKEGPRRHQCPQVVRRRSKRRRDVMKLLRTLEHQPPLATCLR